MSVARKEDSPQEFLRKFGNALLRLAVLAVMGLVHFSLGKGLTYLAPENVPSARLWLQDIAFVFFALIYVYLLWDMVKVFIPYLQSKKYPGLEGATKPGLEGATKPCLGGATKNDSQHVVEIGN